MSAPALQQFSACGNSESAGELLWIIENYGALPLQCSEVDAYYFFVTFLLFHRSAYGTLGIVTLGRAWGAAKRHGFFDKRAGTVTDDCAIFDELPDTYPKAYQ